MPELSINAADNTGTFSAYIAYPQKTPAPAVILIQEIFGVNAEMRQKCDDLAAQGFIAICPDLFWRMEPNVQLTDQTEAEWEKAFGFFQNFDVDKGIDDLKATEKFIRKAKETNDKVGCIGYCLGGKMAYLMAARSTVDASVGYYGVGIDELIAEADHIEKPLMLHIAEEDEFVSKDAQKIIKDSLDGHPHITLHSYEGVNHAFARGNGIHYNKEAAQTADGRTLDFLKKHLGLE